MSTKKKIITIIIGVEAVIIAAVIGFLFYINSDVVKVNRQLELAQKYLLEEDYEQAIAAFEIVIDIDSKNVDAYLGLAEVYAAVDDLENAVKTLERASKKIDSEEVLAQLEIHTAEIEQREQAAEAAQRTAEAAQAAAGAATTTSPEETVTTSQQENAAAETPEPESETILRGFIVRGDDWYYYDEAENLVTGWFDTNGSRYCARTDGTLYRDGGHEIDSTKYQFDQLGVCLGEVKDEAWKQAYIDIINERGTINEYGYEYRYRLIYLDNDDIPELVLDAYGYAVSMCTYKEGQVYTIMESWGYGTGGFFEYIPRKNAIVGNYASGGYGNEEVYWILNDKYEFVEYLRYSLPFNSDDDFDFDNAQYFYYGKEISEEEYNSYYINGSHEILEGTESAAAIIKTIAGM